MEIDCQAVCCGDMAVSAARCCDLPLCVDCEVAKTRELRPPEVSHVMRENFGHETQSIGSLHTGNVAGPGVCKHTYIPRLLLVC